MNSALSQKTAKVPGFQGHPWGIVTQRSNSDPALMGCCVPGIGRSAPSFWSNKCLNTSMCHHYIYIYIHNVHLYIYIYIILYINAIEDLRNSMYIYIYIYVCVCVQVMPFFKNLILDPQGCSASPRSHIKFSPPMPIPVMMRATIKAFSHHANIPGISWDLWKWPFNKYILYIFI